MSDSSNEFYDVKISRDITNEKERNIITDSLVKSEDKYWYNNKCLFTLAFVLSIAISATCIYIIFYFLSA